MTDEQKAMTTEAEKQYAKSQYESTLSDFDELAIQFGYAALFVLAFPIAPLLALINNFFEIRLDSSKLILATRRPEPRGAASIGTWFTIFNIMGFIAVMTNCGIILFVSTDSIKEAVLSVNEDAQNKDIIGVSFVTFIVLEHLLFCLKFAIDFFVPDCPTDVQEHLERQKYITDVLIQGLTDQHLDDEEAKANAETFASEEARKSRIKQFYDIPTIADTFTDTAHLDTFAAKDSSKGLGRESML